MKKAVGSLLCGVCGIVLMQAASAQDASSLAPETAAADESPSEIIVTARKRQESILKVPVVVAALTSEDLEAYSTHDLNAVAQRAPGLLVGTSLAANGVQVSMRGIGTSANNATVDNSISLNVDGLQLSQGLAYNIGMFDVAQIEVLKGPQALFYGKNSPAGVISLRSADPTDKFEVIGRVAYEFEAKEKVGELIISGPVSESLKLRLGARYSAQSGFFRNDAQVLPNLGSINPLDRRVTPTKNLIVRGTALFAPSDAYAARLKASYEYLNLDGTQPAIQIGYCPDGTGAVAPTNIPFLQGDDCKIDRSIRIAWPDPAVFQDLRNGGRPFARYHQALGSLEQELKIADGLSLDALTGFYILDQDYLYLATTTGTALGLVSDSGFNSKQFTQELRLTSDFDDSPLNFMIGAYFQDARQDVQVRLKGNTVLGRPAILTSVDHHIDINSFSVFGQVIWKITDNLEFAPGARWTRETRKHRQININPANGPLGVTQLLVPRLEASNVSPEATLTYSPSDDLTIFGAYKTGFKSGSFNGVVFLSPTTNGAFGDEKVQGGELGLKARLFDRQLSLNLAGYYYSYSDLQVGANEISGTTGALIVRTINAASAKVKGIDFDVSYSPDAVPGLNLRAAINYNNARYSAFPNAPCGNGQTIAQGCNTLLAPATGRFTSQNLGGRELVRAPDWSGTIGFDYEMPAGKKTLLSVGAFTNFSSRYSTNLINQPGFYQEGFAKANVSITLKDIDRRWEISLIGNNLTNKITTGNCFNSNSQNGVFFGGQIAGGPLPGPAGGDEASCVAERGREVWLRLTTRLGDR